MIESVLSSLFTLENLLWINVGLAGGIMVGALPGLTGTMAMALLLPLTYGLASIPGVMLLLGVYCGSIYGGSITAILINTPGTPASAATSLDGYPMAQKGHGLKALHVALSASTIGGLFSCAVLLFAAPPIASFALKFGPAEYFALALFGLTIIASVGGKSQIKGLLMGFVGLLISCIGIDPMDGVSRFTFGINRMEGGIDTIPVLIGLFAITEIMAKARDMNKATGTAVKVEKEKTRFRDDTRWCCSSPAFWACLSARCPAPARPSPLSWRTMRPSGPPSIPRNTGTVPRRRLWPPSRPTTPLQAPP